LLLSADAPAARPQLSINISCLQGTQQQTHQPPLLLLIDEADGCPLAHYILCKHLLNHGFTCVATWVKVYWY